MDISKTFEVRKTALIYEFSFDEEEFLKHFEGRNSEFTLYKKNFCNRYVLMLQMFKGNYEITQFPAPTQGYKIISNGNLKIAELEDTLRSLDINTLEDLLKSMSHITKYKL